MIGLRVEDLFAPVQSSIVPPGLCAPLLRVPGIPPAAAGFMPGYIQSPLRGWVDFECDDVRVVGCDDGLIRARCQGILPGLKPGFSGGYFPRPEGRGFLGGI